MALSDTLAAMTRTSPAGSNRVDVLLDKLAGTDDERVLRSALANPLITATAITKALWAEYGKDVVKEKTVAEWRRNNAPVEVSGL